MKFGYVCIFLFQNALSTIAYIMGLDENHRNVQNHLKNIITEDETFKSIPDVSFLGICEYSMPDFELAKLKPKIRKTVKVCNLYR